MFIKAAGWICLFADKVVEELRLIFELRLVSGKTSGDSGRLRTAALQRWPHTNCIGSL